MSRNLLLTAAMALALLSGCKKEQGSNLLPEDVKPAAQIFPAPPAQWFGGSRPYFSPAGFVGDVMPFYDKDSFHVFYLHDARDGAQGFHPWSKMTTGNFTSYKYNGVMIPYGGSNEQDLALGTGSIIKDGDTYYGYYSGFNHHFNGTGGKYRDVILLATSKDLDTWQKVPGFIIKPETTNGYDSREFRDPYVFFNKEKNEYWMLVGGRKDGKAVVMLYTSNNLSTGNWQLKNPVYTLPQYFIPETPQIFKWGNYWYLVFSENSIENVTRYRYASSSEGPWQKPLNDKLDGEYMYAAKVETDGNNHFLFGWCPTKAGGADFGNREFGGNLVVHQLMQNANGTLNVVIPGMLEKPFTKNESLGLVIKEKQISLVGNNVSFKNSGADGLILFNRMAGAHMITATVSPLKAGATFGLLFGMDKAINNSKYYKINFSEANDLVSGLAINNKVPKEEGKINLALEPGKTYQLKVIIDGSVCVVYIDNKVALTSRIYSINNNQWGLYASAGGAAFNNIQLYGL